jgi:hypothetical protein
MKKPHEEKILDLYKILTQEIRRFITEELGDFNSTDTIKILCMAQSFTLANFVFDIIKKERQVMVINSIAESAIEALALVESHE